MWHLQKSIQHSLHGKGLQFHKSIVQLFDVANGKGKTYENIHDIPPPIYNLITKTVEEEESRQNIVNELKPG